MKIKENIKKIITGITAFFTTITTKVFAKTNTDIQSILNRIDVGGAELYGIERPWQYTVSNGLLKICEFIAIPLILIIGAIIFIQRKKKIKSKNFKKI